MSAQKRIYPIIRYHNHDIALLDTKKGEFVFSFLYLMKSNQIVDRYWNG